MKCEYTMVTPDGGCDVRGCDCAGYKQKRIKCSACDKTAVVAVEVRHIRDNYQPIFSPRCDKHWIRDYKGMIIEIKDVRMKKVIDFGLLSGVKK